MKPWKELLNFDLALLFRSAPAPRPAPESPVYWWARLGRLFGGGRDTAALSAGLARPATWKGPVYWNARVWRRDVVLVSEHIRSLIACNVPLAPGLAAAALEEQRLRRFWNPQRASASVSVIGAIVLLIVLGGSIALDIDGLHSGIGFVQAVVMVGIAAWLIRGICANRSSRQSVFLALERRIASGAGLSDAMGTLPRFFPRHLVDLVEAGEVSGNLDPAFDQFNEAMLHSLGLQRQLKTVLAYLGFVLAAQLSIVSFLLVKVIPVFTEILQEMEHESPGVLNAQAAGGLAPLVDTLLPDIDTLAWLGEQTVTAGPMLAAIAALAAIAILLGRFRKRRHWAARRSASALLFVPWFRGLTVRHNLGLIALMLHGLLRAGVPLDRALAMALGSDVHPAYRRWLGELRARVCQGESLKEAFHSVPARGLIPESFQGLIEAGERSGQLPEMLGRIAELYRRDTEKRLRILHAVVLPAGIFILGYLALVTQVSVFRLLIDMAESIHA